MIWIWLIPLFLVSGTISRCCQLCRRYLLKSIQVPCKLRFAFVTTNLRWQRQSNTDTTTRRRDLKRRVDSGRILLCKREDLVVFHLLRSLQAAQNKKDTAQAVHMYLYFYRTNTSRLHRSFGTRYNVATNGVLGIIASKLPDVLSTVQVVPEVL